MPSSLHCTVVTPEGTLVDTQATSVTLPAWDGQLGILPGHAPLLAKLGDGILKVKTAAGDTVQQFVSGGFAQVEANVLTVLTGEAVAVSELDKQAAEAQLAEAQEVVAHGDEALEAKHQQVAAARARLHAAA